jgi:hypothetical protein
MKRDERPRSAIANEDCARCCLVCSLSDLRQREGRHTNGICHTIGYSISETRESRVLVRSEDWERAVEGFEK